MFELDPERRDELVDSWAHRIVDARLAVPAVFLLEAHKPLAGIGAQFTLAFRPLVTALIPIDVGEVAAFMHKIENIERLEQRIEALEAERRAERRKRSGK